MTVSLPEKKVKKIVQACTELYGLSKVKIRNVAQVLGLMVSSFSDVEYCPFFYRNTEHGIIQALKCHAGDYENFMCVSPEMKQEFFMVDNKFITSKKTNHTWKSRCPYNL